MSDEFTPTVDDIDPIETKEWADSLESVIKYEGVDRARFLLEQILKHGDAKGIGLKAGLNTPYINSIPKQAEATLPGDATVINRLTNYMRWNTIAMVMRGGNRDHSLGGHIASYGSIATLFEIGLHYFFHAPSRDHGGDLVYYQGHSAPGIYARAFLEGRLSEEQLDHFRQEVGGKGISSYPHPWLMPEFWRFPTVSMGLGPIMAIYQAQFLKYLNNRGLANTEERKVWAFCGDGEMGEPESLGVLNIAAREQLDNLIFVVNCNLQRLDGPVWGNGQVIQEFERIYRGAGWNVIKLVWGGDWDALFAKDHSGLLVKRINELLDGEFQNLETKDGAYLREHFFGKYPELLELVADMSDEQLQNLQSGGHDPQKVYAAYAAAIKHKGQPTVILAKTVKGYGMGGSGEGQNIAHNAKKMDEADLLNFRDRFEISLTDKQVKSLAFYRPEKDSAELQFLIKQREQLGGMLPHRTIGHEKLKIPSLDTFQRQLDGSGDREFSTTMSFVRILSRCLKDENIKDRIVPIVVDESRTFGMEGLFRQIGIYSPLGQLYQPEDKKQLMYYREDEQGQLLQQGLNESGAMASWIAAATSYASNKVTMIPFYAYYAMFGYQRFGDLAWLAGDICARGFLLGGLAGRTALAGEGLQHQDGHNLLMFSVVPNCISYDICFNYELAVVIQDGMRRMYVDEENIFYYLTMHNENYAHPAMPEDAVDDIIKGMYLFKEAESKAKLHVQLLGSGPILREVIAAAELLQKEFNVSADIWGVTSFNELRKNIQSVLRYNRLRPEKAAKISHVEHCLKDRVGPVIATTDYIKLFADQIRSVIDKPYYVLGTDGFGRSDSRDTLRDFFEVDAKMIAYTALVSLMREGQFKQEQLLKARKKLNIDPDKIEPCKN